MSDDFGTVNVRRGERAREIELLRQHYRVHRETLAKLLNEAPTEHLAAEYQRLIADIDSSLAKVDEIEGHPAPNVAPPAPPAAQRPLITPPASLEPTTPPSNASNARLLLIVVAGIVVLAIIGYLIYRASGDRRHPVITETTASTTTSTIEPVTPAPTTFAASATSVLTVAPAILDYGTIRKGTRAARQVDVTNNSAEPMKIKVARSQCKCLFYEYKDTIAPKGKETITVTADGARAKAGTLQETIGVSSAKDPSINGSFQVSATIK